MGSGLKLRIGMRNLRMISQTTDTAVADDASPAPEPASARISGDTAKTGETAPKTVPREIGGRDGPEPTRYGDWEKNGRCIDF
jgi:hypothetical protein